MHAVSHRQRRFSDSVVAVYVETRQPPPCLVLDANVALHAGALVGPYRIVRALAATVFLATGDARVVLKLTRLQADGQVSTLHSRELEALTALRHDNIVRLVGRLETPRHACLVVAHADSGDLLDHIIASGRLGEPEAHRIFVQVAAAVRYMHAYGWAHRDIKADNVFLDASHGGGVRAWLGDLGFAVRCGAGQQHWRACGTLHYAAPEVLRGDYYDGPPSDVWSLGILLYAMLHGTLPFYGPALQCAATEPRVAAHVSAPCRALLLGMLAPRVDARLTMAQVCVHAWTLRIAA